jgi:SAM-dependent methyltransferase
LIKTAWQEYNDRVLNIETGGQAQGRAVTSDPRRPWYLAAPSSGAKHDDGTAYQSPDYWYVYRIARLLEPTPQDVFYDLGSGKGRILCVMARRRLKRCIGIELFDSLCEVARANANRLRGRETSIEIRCEDAARANLADGTIYFMFNPFGAETMSDVLDNIEASLQENPRTITIVYHNAYLDALLEERSWLQKCYSFSTRNGAVVSFWKSRPAID